jgi:hypothetical protein
MIHDPEKSILHSAVRVCSVTLPEGGSFPAGETSHSTTSQSAGRNRRASKLESSVDSELDRPSLKPVGKIFPLEIDQDVELLERISG